MPKFEVTVIRTIPEHRERTTSVIEAESLEKLRECFDPYILNDLAGVEWAEVLEGHGGHPIENEVRFIQQVDESAEVDLDSQCLYELCAQADEIEEIPL